MMNLDRAVASSSTLIGSIECSSSSVVAQRFVLLFLFFARQSTRMMAEAAVVIGGLFSDRPTKRLKESQCECAKLSCSF